MAQIYYPKKTSTKLLEGALSGVIGGIVVIVVMALVDFFLTPAPPPTPSPFTVSSGIWWLTPSAIGSSITGQPGGHQDMLDWSYPVGIVLILAAFALLGIGIMNYKPIFRRFHISPALGGAAYGALAWLSLFFFFLKVVNPQAARINPWALLVAMVLGGAAMGWWLG